MSLQHKEEHTILDLCSSDNSFFLCASGDDKYSVKQTQFLSPDSGADVPVWS